MVRETGREGGREREKHQCVVISRVPPTGDLACNPGMCPDWESNLWLFSLQAGTQSTESHQPGHYIILFAFFSNVKNLFSSSLLLHYCLQHVVFFVLSYTIKLVSFDFPASTAIFWTKPFITSSAPFLWTPLKRKVPLSYSFGPMHLVQYVHRKSERQNWVQTWEYIFVLNLQLYQPLLS